MGFLRRLLRRVIRRIRLPGLRRLMLRLSKEADDIADEIKRLNEWLAKNRNNPALREQVELVEEHLQRRLREGNEVTRELGKTIDDIIDLTSPDP